ncbi:hypothetical protein KR009_006679 [Drosophila setifemur]|nr:hypothetical protein KR009_006679 [Drosophila setifemur]
MDVAVVFSLLAILLLHQHQARAQFLDALCGYTGLAPKIMGGTRAQHGANPWMAYLYLDTNTFLCGGTLIHKNFVLTAAHCIVQSENITVRVGEYDSRTNPDCEGRHCMPPAEDYSIEKASHHVHYVPLTFANDIALIRLNRNINFRGRINDSKHRWTLFIDLYPPPLNPANVQPICLLLNPNHMPHVTVFSAYGWGWTEKSNLGSSVLMTTNLNNYHREYCHQRIGYVLTQNQICAGHPSSDTCNGDSGGPLVTRVNWDGQIRHLQLGIVSYGKLPCLSPGVYTQVPNYIDWIRKALTEMESSEMI